MNEFLENLKKEAAANPMVALGLAAALLTAAGKFAEAAGSIQSKRAYARMAEKAAKKSRK